MTMHFRHKSIADSVTERITAIAESVRNNTPLPESRGAAAITLERQDNGDLMVTKSFENGETELLTISEKAPRPALPAGFINVTPDETAQQDTQIAGIDSSGIVEGAALGGDSLDALVRT